MNKLILDYVNQNTERETMDDISTNHVAKKFGLSTKEAYSVLDLLSKDGLITKLDPVNADKFDCCGWIRNND